MACGRNRGYSVPVFYTTENHCAGQCGRQNRSCGAYEGRGFDWLAAMQASAQANCEQNDNYMPIDRWDGRERYLMEVLSMLMAYLHHHHHE